MASHEEPPAELVDDDWIASLFDQADEDSEDDVAEPVVTAPARNSQAPIEVPDESTGESDAFEEIDIPRPARARPPAPSAAPQPSVKGKERVIEAPVDVDGPSDDDLPADPYSTARSPSPPKRRPAVPAKASTSASAASSSRPTQSTSTSAFSHPADLESVEAEIRSIDEEIKGLQKLRSTLVADRSRLLAATAKTASTLRGSRPQAQLTTVGSSSSSRSAGGSGRTVDYATARWPWSADLAAKLKSAWGIASFRPQQEAIINASLDGRDIVVVMPTGAGKSLTYQLPALMSSGTAVVISPLLALMADQVWHLQEAGIEAVALTGSMTQAQQKVILDGLTASGRSAKKLKGQSGSASSSSEVKLLYVTPEKASHTNRAHSHQLVKSKKLVAALTTMHDAGTLQRFVIDEAHCASTFGHDFRLPQADDAQVGPQFDAALTSTRTLFKDVPIIALTATCPPKVLDDLLKVLKMAPTTDSRTADPSGTVLFTAPLYRPNLHYSVLPKPAVAKEALKSMADWILEHHDGECGIVYVLSQKDTTTIADGLLEASGNKVRTAAYHAGLEDSAKERIHQRWREGKIQVVCSTTAFGLGIDHPNVRFVLHHTLSKTLEGLYQESGRGGRDGKPSDCVLWFRAGQDPSRLSSLVYSDHEGASKLGAALAYAVDYETCRKLLFARYFAGRAMASFAGDDDSPCGHCDNCTRDADTVETHNLTGAAWRVLRIVQAVGREDGRVTHAQLTDLVRGLGGGSFTSGAASNAVKSTVNLDDVAGGKIALSKPDTEILIVRLQVDGYLAESFVSTAYAVNTYLQLGDKASRLLRYKTEDELENQSAVTISLVLPKAVKAKRKSAAAKPKAAAAAKGKPATASTSKKRKSRGTSPDDDELEALNELGDADAEDNLPPPTKPTTRARPRPAVLELSD